MEYVKKDTKCSHCREEYVEEMWKVNRTNHMAIPNIVIPYYYCQECMNSAEDVLNEIDTDPCVYGITDIDDQEAFCNRKEKLIHPFLSQSN